MGSFDYQCAPTAIGNVWQRKKSSTHGRVARHAKKIGSAARLQAQRTVRQKIIWYKRKRKSKNMERIGRKGKRKKCEKDME
jgi:hypothetical protein